MKTCQTLHYNKTSATFLFPDYHDALYHYKLKQSNTLVCQFVFYYVNPLNLHSSPHMFEIEIINDQFSIAHLSWPRRNTIHLISTFFYLIFKDQRPKQWECHNQSWICLMFHPVLSLDVLQVELFVHVLACKEPKCFSYFNQICSTRGAYFITGSARFQGTRFGSAW